MSDANAVINAINATGVAEVVKVTETPTQLRITHRVAGKKLSVWLGIVSYVLSRQRGWDAHVSKQYFLKDGKLLYGWNFIAQWGSPEDKDQILKQVRDLLTRAKSEVPQIVHQLESYPIHAKGERNMPGSARMNASAPGPMQGGVKHKGAYKM
jgi:hypothetical protein